MHLRSLLQSFGYVEKHSTIICDYNLYVKEVNGGTVAMTTRADVSILHWNWAVSDLASQIVGTAGLMDIIKRFEEGCVLDALIREEWVHESPVLRKAEFASVAGFNGWGMSVKDLSDPALEPMLDFRCQSVSGIPVLVFTNLAIDKYVMKFGTNSCPMAGRYYPRQHLSRCDRMILQNAFQLATT